MSGFKRTINSFKVLFVCSTLVLFTLSCSERIETPEDEYQKTATSDEQIRTLFFQQATANNWYLIGSKVFQKVDEKFNKSALPKSADDSTIKTDLFSAHHFSNLAISADGSSIMAMSIAYGNTSPENAHLIIFDKELNVLFEDKLISFVGNKGKNTISGLRWSDNKKYITYAQDKNIWLLDLENKKQFSIAADHQRDLAFSAPSWSNDNQHIVYENDQKKVVVLNINSRQKDILAPGRFPHWSPDGKLIVYRQDNGQVIIYSVGLKHQISTFKLVRHHPDYLWTPDSQYIFLAQKIHNSYKSNYFVYSVNDKKLIDLQHKYGELSNHFIQSLPNWFESKLVKLSVK